MKMLVTSAYATNASSNFAADLAARSRLLRAESDQAGDLSGDARPGQRDVERQFGFRPTSCRSLRTPPILASPGANSTGVPTTTSLVWNIAPFAVSYDVYLGTSQANMTLVGNVPAQLVQSPPSTYSWTPPTSLQPGTTYFWKVVSRTNATALVPIDDRRPGSPGVHDGRHGRAAGRPHQPDAVERRRPASASSPTLGWAAGAAERVTTSRLARPIRRARWRAGCRASSYGPGVLPPNTTYYWRVTAVRRGGSTAGAGLVVHDGTGGGGSAADVVIYAADVTSGIHGDVEPKVSDPTAAAGHQTDEPR